MLGKTVTELRNHIVSMFNSGQYAEFLTLGQYLDTGIPMLVAGDVSVVFTSVMGKALLLPKDLRAAVWAGVIRDIEESHNVSEDVPAYKLVIFQHIVDAMEAHTAGLECVSGTVVGIVATVLDLVYRDTGLFVLSSLSFADVNTCGVLSAWLSMLGVLVRNEHEASVFLNMLQARFGRRL